jgi:hypothetical protein
MKCILISSWALPFLASVCVFVSIRWDQAREDLLQVVATALKGTEPA